MLNPEQSLAQLALTVPAASRVFRQHRLDFCCGGQKSVAAACAARGLDAAAILEQIEADTATSPSTDWQAQSLSALIDHILVNFHEAHRRELVDLIELARKVERVHSDKSSLPRGITQHLTMMQEALENHMQKEERILFPAILRGMRAQLAAPIQQMESEHDDHGDNLRVLRDLARDFVAPPEACTSWRALLLRCEQLEADVMAHVHLENHVLFPRVMSDN
jgi:regulator of cell morphogenesis and NO signaling